MVLHIMTKRMFLISFDLIFGITLLIIVWTPAFFSQVQHWALFSAGVLGSLIAILLALVSEMIPDEKSGLQQFLKGYHRTVILIWAIIFVLIRIESIRVLLAIGGASYLIVHAIFETYRIFATIMPRS